MVYGVINFYPTTIDKILIFFYKTIYIGILVIGP